MLDRKCIKDVINISFPAVQEMILYMICTLFSTMMAGKYCGSTPVSAMGITYEIIYMISNIFVVLGICIGITSLTARSVGANKYRLASLYASNGLFLGFLLSVLLFLFIYIFTPIILSITGVDKKVLNIGIPFMQTASIGIFFYMLTNILNSILRGYGNTKTPLIAALIVTISNIIFDYIFVLGFLNLSSMGIYGIATATSLSQFMGFIFILYYSIKFSKIKLGLDYVNLRNTYIIKNLLFLSLPSSLEEIVFGLSKFIGILMVIHIGTTAYAAHQVASTIEGISITLGIGFATSSTTLVGLEYGKSNLKMAYKYSFICTFIGSSIMLICSLAFLSGPYVLMNFFIKSEDIVVIKLGAKCLIAASIQQVPMGISLILGGAFKGIGDTRTPLIVSCISCLIIRLPLLFYFVYIFKGSLIHVWYVSIIQWFIDGLIILILFKKKFKKP